jgi:chromosome segregation ATPase
MTTVCDLRIGFRARATFGVALLVAAIAPALAEQTDRERAQLRQMQQQVQKLMQDNAALQRDNSELKEKLATGEKKSDEAARSLAALKRKSQGDEKDLEATRTDLRNTQQELAGSKADVARLTGELQKRDDALRTAADTQAQMRKSMDAERLELGHRVAQQNTRAELCERKHAELITLSEDILNRYERARTGLIGEPVTRIFAVRAGNTVQELRDRIFDLRLDLPPASTDSH